MAERRSDPRRAIDSGTCRCGHRPAAFFDLDKTIIAKSSTLAFSQAVLPGRPDQPRARCCAARTPSSSTSSAAPTTTRWSGCGQYLSELCAGWDVEPGQGDRRRDPARPGRPDRLRRGRRADRGAPRGRPRRRHRLAPPAPRSSSRSARCSAPTTSSPPGWWSTDGRYTGEIDFYAYGRAQGRGDPRAGRRATGYDLDALLRLQRLGHRPAHARGGRPPVRRQPRQGAARRGRCSAAGRSSSSRPRSALRAASGPPTCRRPGSRWRRSEPAAAAGVVWYAGRRLARDARLTTAPRTAGTAESARHAAQGLRPPGRQVYDRARTPDPDLTEVRTTGARKTFRPVTHAADLPT